MLVEYAVNHWALSYHRPAIDHLLMYILATHSNDLFQFPVHGLMGRQCLQLPLSTKIHAAEKEIV